MKCLDLFSSWKIDLGIHHQATNFSDLQGVKLLVSTCVLVCVWKSYSLTFCTTHSLSCTTALVLSKFGTNKLHFFHQVPVTSLTLLLTSPNSALHLQTLAGHTSAGSISWVALSQTWIIRYIQCAYSVAWSIVCHTQECVRHQLPAHFVVFRIAPSCLIPADLPNSYPKTEGRKLGHQQVTHLLWYLDDNHPVLWSV